MASLAATWQGELEQAELQVCTGLANTQPLGAAVFVVLLVSRRELVVVDVVCAVVIVTILLVVDVVLDFLVVCVHSFEQRWCSECYLD